MSSHRIQLLRLHAFHRQGGLCYYCGVRMWLSSPCELVEHPHKSKQAARLRCTAEHLEPRSAGGRDTEYNIAAACSHCNHTRHRRKAPPPPTVYRQEVQRRMAKGRWHVPWVYKHGLFVVRPGDEK